MINLLIADDHPIYLDGLRTVLADVEDISIVAEARNGLEVLEILKTKPIDIVLLDINMPEMDGIECAKQISQSGQKTKVIMLTQYNERRFINKLEKHIDGYLLKDVDKNTLVQAIRVANIGNKCFFDPKLESVHKEKFRDSFLNSYNISEREKEVLLFICKEMTTNEIAKTIAVSPSTVETYRERLLNKTGSKNLAGLVKWAVENKLA
jgi:DNA-binding NarL/FixJ family response regulator